MSKVRPVLVSYAGHSIYALKADSKNYWALDSISRERFFRLSFTRAYVEKEIRIKDVPREFRDAFLGFIEGFDKASKLKA